MILDKGIFTLFRRTDAAGPGHKPVYDYTLMGKGWYGELDFETTPSRETEGRKTLRIDARIRILQRREIRQHDAVVLADVESIRELPEGAPVYDIERAFHGLDDDGPTPITDLTLREVMP